MPGVIGFGPDAFLGGPRLRRLGEVEPLEFHPAHRREPEQLRARRARASAPGADRWTAALPCRPCVVTNSPRKNGTPSSHGTCAMRAEVDARDRVGEALVPAGERRVVVADVLRVPAEHDVAEAEAAFGRGLELVLVDVLAAQDAVDVGDGDLDAGAGRLADRVDDFRGRGRIAASRSPLPSFVRASRQF